jgi:protein-serine/threonine kinase
MYVSLPLIECIQWRGTGQPGGGSLAAHPELEDEPAQQLSENNRPLPEPKRVVTPFLATSERAISARIYFENFYFPPLRPPWEQRRLAMKSNIIC